MDHSGHSHSATAAIDPVCGMTVDPATSRHRHIAHDHSYYFCSAGCRTKFAADPEKYLEALCPARRVARRHDLYLPDAPGNPAGFGRARARSAAWPSNPKPAAPMTAANSKT